MRRTVSLSLLVGAASSISFAAAEPFNGPFAGIGVGASDSDSDGDDVFDNNGATSAAFSAYVGYDYRLPRNFVVGVEAGAAYTIDDGQFFRNGAGEFNLDPRYEINATGRMGYLVRDDLLVYARGGYATVRTNISPGDDPEFSADLDGWLVGGGLEYAVNENLSGRIEYRYQDVGDDGVELERNQAFAGVSYHF